MKYSKIASIVILSVAAISAGLAWYSPYDTLAQFKKAIETGNVTYVNNHVDTVALKASAKSQLEKKMQAELEVLKGKNEALYSIGSKVVDVALKSALDPMAEAMVTPQGVAFLLQNGALQRDSEDGDAYQDTASVEMGYRSWDKFSVKVWPKKLKMQDGVELTLTRTGFASWTLTDVYFLEFDSSLKGG